MGPRGGDLGRSLSAALASGDLLLAGDGLRRRVGSLDLDLDLWRRFSAGGDLRGDRERESVMFGVWLWIWEKLNKAGGLTSLT